MSELQDDVVLHMAEPKRTTGRRKRRKSVKTTRRKVTTVPRGYSMRPLRCLIPGASIIKANGPVTGQEYTFSPGGVTFVDERDYDGLLARRTNPRRCCGRRSLEPLQMFGVA